MEDLLVFRLGRGISAKGVIRMDSHPRTRCGLKTLPNKLHSTHSRATVTELSSHPISNSRLTKHLHNFVTQVVIRRCSLLCNIQACKDWVKVILPQVGGSTKPIKARSNSCSQVHQVLSPVLRAGHHSNRRRPVGAGAGVGSRNDEVSRSNV